MKSPSYEGEMSDKWSRMMMTVGELKKIIAELPDDMIVASYDAGGYLCWEFAGADVVYDPPPDCGLSKPYLEIGAA